MDLTSIFLFCLISLVIGAVLMILVQYYIFIKYFNQPDDDPNAQQRNRSLNERYQLPDAILGSIHSPELENRNPTIAFNLIFQFLFFELRNANRVRKWFHRKLSLELDELITKTTTGKLFEKLSIRDLDLGAQFPEIRNIKVLNADLHDTEGHLENVELLLDLDYRGNFHLSIDADMVLGKKGFLSIKVNHVSGLARLHFTRKPYTHWSLCFMGDPVIELDIKTEFQGRLMSQSNVTSLISNQIRKAIRRKHTLPNYKLRYKPFFNATLDDDIDLSEIQFDGTLDVNVAELTRISLPCHVNQVYCTLIMATIPFVTASQYDDRNVLCTFDIEIHKAKNQQIGIIFKQIEQTVLIDAIIPNTPAMKAQLCKGDMLVSIEGKKINNINQITKIVKSLNRPVFILRIERIVAGVIKSDMNSFAVGDTDEESYEVINDINISFSKTADTVQISKNVRQSSIDRLSTDSSRSNTPTNSPIKSKEDIATKLRYRGINRSNADTKTSDDTVKCSTPIKVNPKAKSDTVGDRDGSEPETSEGNENDFEMHSTIECAVNSFISMNDLCQFKLSQKSQYLNLNVLGRCNDETILLGYLNIPIQNVLYECSDSTLAHFIKQYKLNPPEIPDLMSHPLSSLSGFDPNLCFGDVLISFSWTGAANTDSIKKTKPMKLSSSAEKLTTEEKVDASVSRQHNFERKHFQSTTQCDFCGRKIWLKDGVQCRDCLMNCHKKCITKCQQSTICGPVDASAALQQSSLHASSVEFKVTDADGEGEIDDFEEIEEPKLKLDQHRQSFSEMISQGIKRVNSANNLAIPAIVSSLNQGTRSLPPSPQHTPRKQSLVNQSTNPFVVVIQKLDQLPNHINDITREQIVSLTEPLIGGWGGPDEMMALAKTASRTLFVELEPNERVQVINNLLSKLKLALDSETKAHANLVSCEATALISDNKNVGAGNASSTLTTDYRSRRSSSAESTPRKMKESEHELAGKAFLVGQSEERVQALSVIMLHLCTGLQYAQGVANQ
ncbi:PDZ domain-containing protein 8 [Sitodiplosis mosellana]|uniref:PDZ domain-containing protein 8 n=1 Tax=Sitodiplosis mosellana TaxID=263140 RepID=UPI002443E4A6|nr:PDZ domain-containing protein 8 [Sitodiplosis mosellana]XP_055295205.1 PDZ domain-containing protein 8 [Sitodiplosis mosellana]XP_055295212.1 PDZ domain-containing protein 8 [Sitodiplosis mosellana]XP_055295221.1 PDZ domain-containing protein 8 [Sitodiplosis mosellana]XP_055295230.1 PDZ domain-containing protein 8 [Sitodiplosis mosellana]